MKHVVILIVLALVSTFPAIAQGGGQISVTGCGISKKAYMGNAIKAYAAKVGARPRLSGGGAQKGIRLAAGGKVNVGATCRHRLVDDSDNLYPAEKNAKLIPVGWDALVAITHKSNPVKNLSSAQLKDIFEGKITNWSEFGGNDMPITVMTRSGSTSGVGYMARLMIFGSPDYQYKAKGRVFKSTGPLEKNVSATPGAIALDGVSSARMVDVAIIGIDGFQATKPNIASGDYPFFRPLYVAVNATKQDPMAEGFVDFLLGAEGQKIISDSDTVNLAEGATLPAKWKAKTRGFGRAWREDAFN